MKFEPTAKHLAIISILLSKNVFSSLTSSLTSSEIAANFDLSKDDECYPNFLRDLQFLSDSGIIEKDGDFYSLSDKIFLVTGEETED